MPVTMENRGRKKLLSNQILTVMKVCMDMGTVAGLGNDKKMRIIMIKEGKS